METDVARGCGWLREPVCDFARRIYMQSGEIGAGAKVIHIISLALLALDESLAALDVFITKRVG